MLERWQGGTPERIEPRAAITMAAFGLNKRPFVLWRILRTSVPWTDTEQRRLAERQRIVYGKDLLPCLVLGFDRLWWYASVETRATYQRMLDVASEPCPECAPDHQGFWDERKRRWTVCHRCGDHGRILTL